MRLALYQPEIPQNTGTLIRLGSCLNVGIDIIDPCGFAFSDRKLQRAGMDYLDCEIYTRHETWTKFIEAYPNARLVLITTQASTSYIDFSYEPDDILIVGQESTGFPTPIESSIKNKVLIPMAPQRRSLNVAVAAGMVVGEALRQTDLFPS